MDFQTYIKSFAECVLSDEDYALCFKVIRDPEASEEERGTAAMRVACSCYLQIVKLIFRFRTVGRDLANMDLIELMNFSLQALAEICLQARSYDPAKGHIMPYAKLALKGRLTDHVTKYRKCLAIIRDCNVVELDVQVSDELGSCTYAEIIGDTRLNAETMILEGDEAHEWHFLSMLVAIDLALEGLEPEFGPRDTDVLKQRLGYTGNATLSEIGQRYGLSRERIRQIEERGLKRLSEMTGITVEQLKAVAKLARYQSENARQAA